MNVGNPLTALIQNMSTCKCFEELEQIYETVPVAGAAEAKEAGVVVCDPARPAVLARVVLFARVPSSFLAPLALAAGGARATEVRAARVGGADAVKQARAREARVSSLAARLPLEPWLALARKVLDNLRPGDDKLGTRDRLQLGGGGGEDVGSRHDAHAVVFTRIATTRVIVDGDDVVSAKDLLEAGAVLHEQGGRALVRAVVRADADRQAHVVPALLRARVHVGNRQHV
jgi:hypothetical protein